MYGSVMFARIDFVPALTFVRVTAAPRLRLTFSRTSRSWLRFTPAHSVVHLDPLNEPCHHALRHLDALKERRAEAGHPPRPPRLDDPDDPRARADARLWHLAAACGPQSRSV